MNTPDPGPDPRVSQHLAGRLAGFCKEAVGKQIITPGVKVPCQICGKHFGGVFKPQTKHYCKACRKTLSEGWTVVRTATGRMRFYKSEKMRPEWVGEMGPIISEDEMDELEAAHAAQQRKANGGDAPNLN